MATIDNLELIKPLLNYEKEGDFYMLYVLKRKKDQPEGERDNHQSVRTIKTYCIESIEHLEKRYDEIKTLCEIFKARAYIHMQKQNHADVSLNMLVELATRIKSGSHNQKGLFDSTVGQIKTSEKRWIVDIDTKDERALEKISGLINRIRPEGDKIYATIPTKSGYHLITGRFDVMEFNKIMELQGDAPDIQKKNPTMLYYPDSLDTQ
jgi:outer membrane translocation and assembly module TamA